MKNSYFVRLGVFQNPYTQHTLQAYFRLGKYWDAAEDAFHALKIHGCQEKSLYRRAMALVMHVHDQIWTSNYWNTCSVTEETKICVHEARESLLLLQSQHDGEDKKCGISMTDVHILMEQIDVLSVIDLGEAKIEELVQSLREDIEGDEEVDVCQTLEDLISIVKEGGVASSLTLLRATQGFRLLWYFMNDATAGEVCRLVQAAHVSCILWPKDVWEHLIENACAYKGKTEYSWLCMDTLLKISEMNDWVKFYLFPSYWNENGSIIRNIVVTIGSCHLAIHCIGKDAVATGCDILSCYGENAGSVSNGLARSPMRLDVFMKLLDAFENAEEIVKNSGQNEGKSSDNNFLNDSEAKAKEELLKKRNAVYNPSVVMLKKKVLACIKDLCTCRQLVLGELIEWKDGKKCASQLHHRLVSLGKNLVHSCPKRSTKMLDMNLNLVSYEKKPYAADIVDNPAGDFLATIDLDNPGNVMKETKTLQSKSSFEAADGSRPIVEMFLDILCTLSEFDSSLVASLLFKAGIFSICQLVAEFQTISTVEIAQKICTNILLSYKDSKKALLESTSVVLLAGILKYAKDDELESFAINELCCMTSSCQGNDFVRLIDAELGILKYLNNRITEKSPTPENVIHFVEVLAKRTIQCGSFKVVYSGHKIPKGHGWGYLDQDLLDTIMYHKQRLSDASVSRDDFDPECFVKGFLNTRSLQSNTPDQQEAKTSKPQVGVKEKVQDKESIKQEEHSIGSSAQGLEETELLEMDDEEESIQITEVYDSTPAEHIRASRVTWLALDEKKRTTWEQTSSDLTVWIKVPEGTKTDEVSVDVCTTSITVRLKWFGKILHGELFGRVKAHEYTWCLLDDEIQLILPKDSSEHWWKTLIKGWEEKGYYDLLKDAVDADEPHVSYDDMDESAKDLLDSMLERQAYINAGMLDLENSFDDFRIVLSDSSLQGGREPTT